MPSLEKAIKKFLDSDGVKGQAGTWVLLSDENGDIKLYEHYGYLVGTIIDGHMIWRDNKEYYVSETYSDMILKSLYDGGLIDKYTLKESTKKFSKEGTESNPRFKCMESEKSDPLHICPYCGNDKVYDDPQSQDDRKIYLSDISDGGKFRVERHCSECDHYWDVVMKTIVDHIDGD